MRLNDLKVLEEVDELKIRWIIETSEVWLGEFEDLASLESEKYFGSKRFLWSDNDIFLFSKKNKEFYSAIFSTGIVIPSKVELNHSSFSKTAKIKYSLDSEKDFSIFLNQDSFYNKDSDTLLSINSKYLNDDLTITKLCVDFNIIFDNASGDFIGWTLRNASGYISDGSDYINTKTSLSFRIILDDYFEIMRKEEFLLENDNSFLEKKIKAILFNLDEKDCKQSKILSKCLERYLDFNW